MHCIRPPPPKVGAFLIIIIINCYPHLYYHPYPNNKLWGEGTSNNMYHFLPYYNQFDVAEIDNKRCQKKNHSKANREMQLEKNQNIPRKVHINAQLLVWR